MRLTVLGSGTGVPDPLRGPAGLLLQVGARAWLVDGGSGTLQRCARAGVDPRALHGGFYSHRHPDHCADLVPLLFAMRVPPARERDYPVYAGAGFADFAESLQQAWGKWMRPGQGQLVVRELSLEREDHLDLGDLTVRTAPAAHSASALHLRFEADGHAIVFSGDTGPSEHLVRLAEGADLLVCECGGSDDEPVPGHLSPSDIAELVDAARPAAVWLTHLYPHVDAAEAVARVQRTGVAVRRADDLDRWPEDGS